MKMTESDHQPPSRQTRKQNKKSRSKSKSKHPPPFFPSCPTEVGSPKDNGYHFYPRSVCQRTPKKLCTLVLPPPLNTMFDGNANNGGAAEGNTRVSSDNVSVDGHSIMDSSPIRHSSNISISASVGAATHGGNTQQNNLPLHLRVGIAPCKPLLAFDGKYTLVATLDGRIAIYSVWDFDRRVSFPGQKDGSTRHMSEDVEASERRRRAEWEEEDFMEKQFAVEEENKYGWQDDFLDPKSESEESSDSDSEDDENELEMKERMLRRERAREMVDPILIVTLPMDHQVSSGVNHDKNGRKQKNNLPAKSHEDETTGSVINPPTIVAMCATPGTGTSLIEQRDVLRSSSENERQANASTESEKSVAPSRGSDEYLLGHVAVLTDEGCVHILEFTKTKQDDSVQESSEKPLRSGNGAKSILLAGIGFNGATNNVGRQTEILVVNSILVFHTGFLNATCICMRPIPSTTTQPQFNLNSGTRGPSCDPNAEVGSLDMLREHLRAESAKEEHNDFNYQHQSIRLCIGHESGVLVEYQAYSDCIYTAVRKCRSSPKNAEQKMETTCERASIDIIMEQGKAAKTMYLPTSSSVKNKLTPHHSIREKGTPPSSASQKFYARSKSNDFSDTCEGSIPPSPEQGVSRALFDHDENATPIRRTFSEPMTPDPTLSRGKLKNDMNPLIQPAKVELLWRGNIGVPICSLSCPGWGRSIELETTNVEPDGNAQHINECKSPSLLVVGLLRKQTEQFIDANQHFLSPSISIEVINTTRTEMMWSKLAKDGAMNTAVPLNDCSVWPVAGMEIKDGWLRHSGRKKVQKDQMHEMLELKKMSATEQICCFEDEARGSCFASAASDGTVAISHCDGKSWGIKIACNQVMLFQKCIGIGTITMPKNKALHSRYVASCLRGGTVYLIPVIEYHSHSAPALPENQNITMFSIPVNRSGEDDAMVRSVQSFATGMLRIFPWTEASVSGCNGDESGNLLKPVIMVGWTSNIDVYEIEPVK